MAVTYSSSGPVVAIASGTYKIGGTEYSYGGGNSASVLSTIKGALTSGYYAYVVLAINSSGTISALSGYVESASIADAYVNYTSDSTKCKLATILIAQNDATLDPADIKDWSRMVVNTGSAITLAGTPDYITISGDTITRNQIDLTADVTGVLPSANLDSDTAHLSGAQTFSGAATFRAAVDISGTTTTFSADNPVLDFTYNGDVTIQSNGGFDFYLDQNINQSSEFRIYNGSDSEVFAIDESGGLTISGLASFSSTSDAQQLYVAAPRDGQYDPVAHFLNSHASDTSSSVVRVGFTYTSPTGNNRYIFFAAGSQVVGSINGQVTYTPFTGAHNGSTNSSLSQVMLWRQGMILSSNGQIVNNNPNISNAFVGLELSNTAKDNKIMGVFDDYEAGHTNVELNNHREIDLEYYYDNSEGETIKCSLVHRDMDFEDNIIQYNAVGEGMILVSNEEGDISNGDYITTSTYAGIGVLQDDDILHSYTVAKCTQEIDWNNVAVDSELGIKVKLVACTYHCG